MIAGGEDKHLRAKYDVPGTKEKFITLAASKGYDFTVEELEAVLQEFGDVFEKKQQPAQTLNLVDIEWLQVIGNKTKKLYGSCIGGLSL